MRNRRKMRSQMDAIDQINVTPLLDLTFLLLIVFMITMPLMSVFFCFSLPSAIGIYWVVQGAFQLVQQLIVNAHMNKIDVDDLIRRNVEKMNKKRARKGLPPANVSEKASVNLKALQAREDAESKAKEDKISRNKKQMEASEAFYNSDPKPGSLASKAGMVAKYNEQQEKGNKK